MTDDARLLAHVHPPDWQNPTPKDRYDLVVIGGGTAGLVCAAGAGGLGARVALVERARLGGDCLNTGCVPSKALLRSARVAGEARAGGRLGVPAEAVPDFAAVMARLRARRADIAPGDSAARLASRGVDVFFGEAAFSGPTSISVREGEGTGSELRFRRAVIASGSRPAVPPIPGLKTTPYLTSENVFDLTVRPRELVVLGGGPIGCELAQAFARLGTRVTLVEAAGQILSNEDADAAAIVRDALAADGVDVRTGAKVTEVARSADGVVVAFEGGRTSASALLVATGRAPNVEGLNLEAAGVEYGRDGVEVSDRLQTSNPHVFAAGDIASKYKFTHAADALARTVIQNALFFGRKRAGDLLIPWCTFTTPEVAHVGLNQRAAAETGAETMTIPFEEVDRAVVDEETAGFVRLHHRRGRIAGATIVAPAAGEMIGLVVYAMQQKASVGDLSGIVFPYPTVSLALRQAGDAHRRNSLTPAVQRLLESYFAWMR